MIRDGFQERTKAPNKNGRIECLKLNKEMNVKKTQAREKLRDVAIKLMNHRQRLVTKIKKKQNWCHSLGRVVRGVLEIYTKQQTK